jgi:hypothetical protein
VEYGGHTELGIETPFVQAEGFQGVTGAPKHEVVDGFGVSLGQITQFAGQREGHQEVLHR